MGRVKRFNIGRLMRSTDAKFFFETGTWKGDGLAYAARYPFEKLFSSEIIPSIAHTAAQRFARDKRVVIINENSSDALLKYVHQITGNCIFWLDAHFPGAEEGLKDYNEFEDETVKLPLQHELEIIAARAKDFKDIILIDDLRIYEENNYRHGNLPENVLPPAVRSIQFAFDLFGKTHMIERSLYDEGYLYLIPKDAKQVSFTSNLMFAAQNKLLRKII